MIAKSTFVFLSSFSLLKLAFVSCVHEDLFYYDKGFHEIKEGEMNKESLLYEGKVTGMSLMSPLDFWKEVCYPNNGLDKKPNEHVKITGYLAKDQQKVNDEAVAFHTSGGLNEGQVCFFFLTRPGGRLDYTVTVYGQRLVDHEPPLEPNQKLRQPMGKEMFQEPYHRAPIIVPAGSALKDTFGKKQTSRNQYFVSMAGGAEKKRNNKPPYFVSTTQ